jgi:hypothetical protein
LPTPADIDLLTLQRRFLNALGEPIFGDSRARSELPDRAGEASASFVATANDLIAPSRNLAPIERLELYHRQYWYRLLDSLAEDFPALRRFLGEPRFWSLLERYLLANPPRSYTLRHLGAGLADFIAQTPESLPHPVHAAELARIEYALCDAFAAGDKPPVAPDELAHARQALQPHLTLLGLRTPADLLWRRGGRLRQPLRSPSLWPTRYCAVFREGSALAVERLPNAAYAILAAIARLGSLDQALSEVCVTTKLLRRRDAGRVQEWFRVWTVRGWLCQGDPAPTVGAPRGDGAHGGS